MFLKKILEVFTKEYREETKYQIFMEKHKDMFRLNDNAEPVEAKIERLKQREVTP